MTKLILSAGTDDAAMALFDVDSLPAGPLKGPEHLEEWSRRHVLMQLPTGAEGAYLLHAYADEEIPAALFKYCRTDDSKTHTLVITAGNIGYGGLESVYAGFRPNTRIRSEGKISSGTYDVVAYRTEYPEGLVENAMKAKMGSDGYRLHNSPSFLIPASLVAAFIGFVMGGWIVGVAVLIGALGALTLLFQTAKFKQLETQSRDANSEYPNIVVRMTKRER